ncbi:hypothetical protein TNCV_1019121 [Trichonephila clavipes]|nr:hypothetical protein TNCV_1019121 [Trichonephila clavipes]
MWRRLAEQYNSTYSVEQHTSCTAGVVVWETVGYDGQFTLVVECGTLTEQHYFYHIIRHHVEPFLNDVPGTIFQLDNARPRIQLEKFKTRCVMFKHFQGWHTPRMYPLYKVCRTS